MTEETLPRRKFLLGVGVAGSAVVAGLASPPAQAETTATAAATPTVTPVEAEPLLFLNEIQHAFVVAAVDMLIPADELSPSGSDCGCAVYIDRQLASAWGGGAKMYRAGPYFKGKPEQGYQLPLTPAEFFVAGITAANEWSHRTYGHDFDRLPPDKRVEALKAMEEGKADFKNFNAKAFFGRLHAMTVEGFFADPIYGGNRGKVSWKMLGFPGLPATYAQFIDEYRDKRYVADPQSIADFS
ncbi:MAG TPA: gluconate 2-dehydrogenase subunit 3 family protein [Xanthobacteraceae bacterium]|jgi:gluconate 2-dehydrogenase gamma chain|nr:gluconate 2-dehydrogenase subunit 3 family protein [Xanthobacteraceae bacterium]